MGKKVDIIQLQQEIIDIHNEVWNKVFKSMAEGELVEAVKLADSIDNSEFESLGAEENEPRANTRKDLQSDKGSRTGSIEEAENKNPSHCHYELCK